ncbi:MAG: AMP-binding protein [Betaproteobacteria bacterium]|nr:AMP-binding protein [Betaproteobacteria bacterium]
MNKRDSAQVDRYCHERMPAPQDMPQIVFDRPELQFGERLNAVAQLLDRRVAAGEGARPLLRSAAQTLSYAETLERVNRVAQVLTQDLGLVPGNRVLLRGPNSIGMALAWLATVKAGLVAVGTMPLLRAKELSDILDKAQPNAALCDAKLQDELRAACAQHALDLPVVLFNAAGDPLDLMARCAAKSAQFDACDTAALDVAMMAFTSGTTGKPKAAMHTHRDLLAACEAWPRHVLQCTPDDIVVGSPPLAFTFGLGGLLLFPLWAGASVHFADAPYTPESMVQTINAVGATVCYTAPTFYRQMAPFARTLGVPTLRKCVSAGEGLPDATRQLWKQASGVEMIDGIGATEMFHIFISSAGEQVRRGAIGQVVPGYVAKVVDDDGRELPPGTVGKLAVIGPTGCKYLDDVRQHNYVKGGWNYPGDAFVMDADGYFFYQARADDMIITAGYNVAGPEVEAALLLHPAVAECGVVGQPDDERGMIVKAYVVLRAGHAGDAVLAKALQDHVKQALAPYKYPREVAFVTALPRTETGKLQRFKLREGGLA